MKGSYVYVDEASASLCQQLPQQEEVEASSQVLEAGSAKPEYFDAFMYIMLTVPGALTLWKSFSLGWIYLLWISITLRDLTCVMATLTAVGTATQAYWLYKQRQIYQIFTIIRSQNVQHVYPARAGVT